jgi:translation elongation factor EF-Ts
MLVRSLYRGLFSTVKVSIESIKKLREETSAPMGECRKALEES